MHTSEFPPHTPPTPCMASSGSPGFSPSTPGSGANIPLQHPPFIQDSGLLSPVSSTPSPSSMTTHVDSFDDEEIVTIAYSLMEESCNMGLVSSDIVLQGDQFTDQLRSTSVTPDSDCLDSALVAMGTQMSKQSSVDSLSECSSEWSADPIDVKPSPAQLLPQSSQDWLSSASSDPEEDPVCPKLESLTEDEEVSVPIKSPPSYFEHITKYSKVKTEMDPYRSSCALRGSTVRFHPGYQQRLQQDWYPSCNPTGLSCYNSGYSPLSPSSPPTITAQTKGEFTLLFFYIINSQ